MERQSGVGEGRWWDPRRGWLSARFQVDRLVVHCRRPIWMLSALQTWRGQEDRGNMYRFMEQQKDHLPGFGSDSPSETWTRIFNIDQDWTLVIRDLYIGSKYHSRKIKLYFFCSWIVVWNSNHHTYPSNEWTISWLTVCGCCFHVPAKVSSVRASVTILPLLKILS